jgi:hypothetical protein
LSKYFPTKTLSNVLRAFFPQKRNRLPFLLKGFDEAAAKIAQPLRVYNISLKNPICIKTYSQRTAAFIKAA